MQDVYKNIEEYSPDREGNVLIVFDNMIVDTISNKRLSPIVTELFIKGRKLNVSTVFIPKSYFQVPKDVKLYTFFHCENSKQMRVSTNRI